MDASPTIQWYPGHIAKLARRLQQVLKQLDVVIEVRDARIPMSTSHDSLAETVRQQKPVLLILNKADLADSKWTPQWEKSFAQIYPAVLSFDSTSGKGKSRIIDQVCKLGEAKMQQQEAKGLKRRSIRTGIIGMPNVGKSSLINALVEKKKAQTGHRAGVTRTVQWIRLHPQVDLLDTPGLIPPRLASEEMGLMLASVYSIGEATFEEAAIVPFFLEKVESLYPGLLQEAFDLSPEEPLSMEAIAKRRGYILTGGQLDLQRTAQAVLKDYRHGRLGRLTLERPVD
jgi:ribosome biogenesis GTPase A